jgi:hypothetical protein
MALGELERAVFGKAAEDPGIVGGGTPQQIEMAAPSDAIANQAADAQLAVEVAKAACQSRHAARHPGCVAHEQHRSREPLRYLGRRPDVIRRRGAVEQSHDSFDERDVGAARDTPEGGGDGRAPHHPAVEVVTRDVRRPRMVRRVEVVGAALEDAHA